MSQEPQRVLRVVQIDQGIIEKIAIPHLLQESSIMVQLVCSVVDHQDLNHSEAVSLD